MRITLIVACDRRGVIGRDGGLPWHLPADLARFKRLTMGKPIVMGRRTHESIGRPLPGRKNLVLSRDSSYRSEGCLVVSDVAAAREAAAGAQELMVIGGSAVYRAFLDDADRIERTVVEAEIDGDTYFPEFDEDEFRIAHSELRDADERNPWPLTFQTLERVRL